MTTESELKEIRSLLLELNRKVEGLNQLMEKRLIECSASVSIVCTTFIFHPKCNILKEKLKLTFQEL